MSRRAWNMFLKPLVVLLLCISMTAGSFVVPRTTITAEAAGIDQSTLSTRIADFIKKYPNGNTSFGKDGCWRYANAFSNAVFGEGIPNQTGDYNLKGALGNWYVVEQAASGPSASKIVSVLKQAQPGDLIQYKSSHATYSHTVMVVSASSSGITFRHSSGGKVSSTTLTFANATDKAEHAVKYDTNNEEHKKNCSWGKWPFDGFACSNKYGLTLYRNKQAPAYTAAAAVPKLASQTAIAGGVLVKLSCATSGAAIYYTTNGSVPTTSSTKYSSSGINLTNTATIKAIAVKSGLAQSGVMSKKITVNQTAVPSISSTISADAFYVTISGEKGAKIYYTIDGSTPTKASQVYNGQIRITDSRVTVKAIAVKDGQKDSTVASKDVSGEKPSAPSISMTTDPDIGIGDEVSIKWNAVSGASDYKINIIPEDSSADTIELSTQGTAISAVLNEAGSYTVSATASNFLGESAQSNVLSVTVHEDCNVVFLDYDETVYHEETVKYGGDAVVPVDPERTGYNFYQWSAESGKYKAISLTNIRTDTIAYANYNPKKFQIAFVDRDGNTIGSKNVSYGSSYGDPPAAPAIAGCKFMGWSVKSGAGNSYTEVNGAAVFEPIYTETDADMPMGLTLSKAERSSDSRGYNITVAITNALESDTEAKIIASIRTTEGKLLATQITDIQVPASASDYEKTVYVSCAATGKVAEAYLVGNDPDNSNRTGGALSLSAECSVTKSDSSTTSYWSEFTDWSTTPVTESDTVNVESKTQYSYRTMSTTTSTSPSLDGWTQSGSTVTYSNWGSWSGWSLTAQTASTTKAVETRTVYVYFHYCASSTQFAPSTSYTYGKYGPHYVYSTTKYSMPNKSSTGYYYGTISGHGCEKTGCTSYYYKGTATQYRYRTRTATTTYSYYKWSDWSAWGDAVQTASSTKEVKTQTVYRYQELITETSTTPGDIGEETSSEGTRYDISGNLTNIAEDYSGKYATVMVYKETNSDPTEEQLEFVSEIQIGGDNSFSLSFIPREEISTKTGDYIVSFGIENASGLLNYQYRIEAPKPTWQVAFNDPVGNVIEVQTVEEGKSAVAPKYSVTGHATTWDTPFNNVKSNLEVTAVVLPETYAVVFVDWANSEILKVGTYEFGSTLEYPDDPSAEGKIFTGWSLPEGSVVNGTTIIEAEYEDILCNVTFLNKDGTEFYSEQVVYGENAILPEESETFEGNPYPVYPGMQFVAWDTSDKWWGVTEDITVNPIFIYNETTEIPIIEVDFDSAVLPAARSMACLAVEAPEDANAVFYYTTDGSEPTTDCEIYEGGILFEADTTVKMMAVSPDKNDSSVVTVEIDVMSEEEYSATLPSVTANTSSGRYNIGETSATLVARISSPSLVTTFGCYVYDDTGDCVAEAISSPEGGVAPSTFDVAFSIKDGLIAGADYSYQFYVFSDNDSDEPVESDLYSFTTTGGGGQDEIPVSAVELDLESAEMLTEETLQLTATVLPEDAANKDVLWTSSNEEVATVDENGLVTAKTYGTSIITAASAEDSEIKAICELQTRYYDVADSSRYWFNPVYWAADRAITKGYGNVYFGPEENCKREQMITFLWRQAGEPEPTITSCPLSDAVSGKYYYKPILWAYENGITKGYSDGPNKGTFGVGLEVTREDTVTFIYRMAGKPEIPVSESPFPDVPVSKYYCKPVAWAAANGITKGYSSGQYAGKFGVGLNVLRKDIVTFLYRYDNL